MHARLGHENSVSTQHEPSPPATLSLNIIVSVIFETPHVAIGMNNVIKAGSHESNKLLPKNDTTLRIGTWLSSFKRKRIGEIKESP